MWSVPGRKNNRLSTENVWGPDGPGYVSRPGPQVRARHRGVGVDRAPETAGAVITHNGVRARPRAAVAARVRRTDIRCTEVPSWCGTSAAQTAPDSPPPPSMRKPRGGAQQTGAAGFALQTMTVGSGARHAPGVPTHGPDGPHTVAGQRRIPTGFPQSRTHSVVAPDTEVSACYGWLTDYHQTQSREGRPRRGKRASYIFARHWAATLSGYRSAATLSGYRSRVAGPTLARGGHLHRVGSALLRARPHRGPDVSSRPLSPHSDSSPAAQLTPGMSLRSICPGGEPVIS